MKTVGKSRRSFNLVVVLMAFAFGCQVWGVNLVETDGVWFIASPQFFGDSNSGTYYNPTSIEAGGYAFLFTQGGQFDAVTSPVSWCGGDHVVLWRAPLTDSGLRNPFMPLRRITHCDTTSATVVHWTIASVTESSTGNSVLLVAERQAVDRATGSQVSAEVWLLEGYFSLSGSDIDVWSQAKLFAVEPTVPGKRITSTVVTADTSRLAPNDGYSHDFYRGFARQPSFNMVELRFDLSQKYCDQGTSSSQNLCVLIEFNTSSGWEPIVGGVLDFVPAAKLTGFIPADMLYRNGALELWGKALVSGNNCPCDRNTTASQYRWYTVDQATFGLSGPNSVFSQLRCMPTEPHNFRAGIDVVLVGNSTYLVSGQNDDQPCGSTGPFIGQDTVVTLVQ